MIFREIKFLDYDQSYLADCLGLFDENCPTFFTENEKFAYNRFLESEPAGYFVVQSSTNIVAAFGISNSTNSIPKRARLSWILVSQNNKGKGVGRAIMYHVQKLADEQGVSRIEIAASHLSAPFFAKFGAIELNELSDGWGEGMHRIDMELKVSS